MKEITVLSGKGGAGKTSVVATLASLASNAVFCDNDVDAADLHLLFHPEIEETLLFDSGTTAKINQYLCSRCKLCYEHCRFSAIHTSNDGSLIINPYQCEGCKLCERICPSQAITSKQNLNNEWFVSATRFGPMVHAKMGVGEENSGKLVTQIRNKAKEIAREIKADFVINDGPPGIGCTAISSITNTNVVLLVIEPSVSGLHDVKRLIQLVQSFNIPMYALINKFNINQSFSEKIERFLKENGIPLLSKIPFSEEMVESIIQGKSIIEYAPNCECSQALKATWDQIR